MTRDELITKYILPAVHHHWNEKIYDEIEQMLKQEPCDDAISRRAVLEMAYDMSAIDGEHFTGRYLVVDAEDIQKLLSVTLQPKIGHWIEHKWAEEVDGCLISNFECSCCHTWKRDESSYCPDCGAKMESEWW